MFSLSKIRHKFNTLRFNSGSASASTTVSTPVPASTATTTAVSEFGLTTFELTFVISGWLWTNLASDMYCEGFSAFGLFIG